MFKDVTAFSSFSVDDMVAAKAFYGETLGLDVEDTAMGILSIHLFGGTEVMVYPKDNHQPATFTVLNFPVSDLTLTVEALKGKGVRFEHYDGDGIHTGDDGIARGNGQGPDVAWFKDPAGNILSVMSEA